MPLPPLYGHERLRNRLAGAIASGRLPQALLFEGPRGVGKQRLALWLAQALLCERGRGTGEGCGSCRACKLVATLSHPDLHWFVPIEPPPSKRSGDADKQVDLVEGALAEEMAARRERPLYEPASGLASHAIASVRLLLRRLVLTPVMGRRKVFIVGDAERLVPQRANPEAANALLKALEEPPADTNFVLTASDATALLPTIMSRIVRVRVARLADSVVVSFIQRELKPAAKAQELGHEVALAQGCIGRLLANQGAGAAEAAAVFLKSVEGGPASWYAHSLAQAPYQARGAFTDMLDELLDRLRAQARERGETRKVVQAIARVLEARAMAQGNVNPQLVAAVLAEDLAETR